MNKVPRQSNNRRGDPLEKTIERRVCSYAEREYGMEVRKFVSSNHRCVPDRMFFGDNGLIFFIEFKRKGLKLTIGQGREKSRLEKKGARIYVVDGVDAGKELIDRIVEDHNFRHEVGGWIR